MNKFKGTIRIDQGLWNDFKEYCAKNLNQTVSERIRELISNDMKASYPWDADQMNDVKQDISQTKYHLRLLQERVSVLEAKINQTDKLTDEPTDKLTDKLTDERKTYKDGQVAAIETQLGKKKTRQTVTRYRTGERQPKDPTFWERWEKSINGSSWYRQT